MARGRRTLTGTVKRAFKARKKRRVSLPKLGAKLGSGARRRKAFLSALKQGKPVRRKRGVQSPLKKRKTSPLVKSIKTGAKLGLAQKARKRSNIMRRFKAGIITSTAARRLLRLIK